MSIPKRAQTSPQIPKISLIVIITPWEKKKAKISPIRDTTENGNMQYPSKQRLWKKELDDREI